MRFSHASVMFAITLTLTLFVDASLAQSGSRISPPQSVGISQLAAPSNFSQPGLSQPSFESTSVVQQGFGSSGFSQPSYSSATPVSDYTSTGTPAFDSNAVSGYVPTTNYAAAAPIENYQPAVGSGNCGGGCGGGCGAKCGRPYDSSPGLFTRDDRPQIGRAYGRPMFGRWCGY